MELSRSSQQRCFMKKVFLEISQNSQENTCARVSFLKKRLWQRCFPVNFVKFLRTPFLQNTSVRLLLAVVELLLRFLTLKETQRTNVKCCQILLQKSFILTMFPQQNFYLVCVCAALWLFSEYIQYIMSKVLSFISCFHHERRKPSLKSQKISETETLDYTEIFLCRIYQKYYLFKEEKNAFFATWNDATFI